MLKVANSVISASRITGVLPVVNGGTGVTTSTGTGNTVLSAAPTLTGDINVTSGNLLVGSTSTTNTKIVSSFDGNTQNGLICRTTTDASGAGFIYFYENANVCGYVSRVSTTSAVVYSTSSDYRLKTVIGAVTGQGARIDALKPIDYQWKKDNIASRGFLAHEFQTVYPNSVQGNKDAVDADGEPKYQAMQASTSEVIADLVAEIQSLRKRLLILETKCL